MREYAFKEIDGIPYVIDVKTGCSLVYHSKIRKYDIASIPGWKFDVFSEWLGYSNSRRAKLRSVYKEKVDMMNLTYLGSYTISNCVFTVDTTDYNKEEETMYNNEKSETQSQRNHLMYRAEDVYNDKRWEVRKSFGLEDDDRPQTGKELVERILAGKYVMPDNKADCFDDPWGNPLRQIIWRDPNAKKDQEGFDAAADQLSKEFTFLQDTIKIEEPKVALEALREFEAKTFH
jgi:hypothetical protein